MEVLQPEKNTAYQPIREVKFVRNSPEEYNRYS
jgi:hypothetical protein